MSMCILGLSPFHGGYSAVLVVDGEIIAAAQERSATRQSYDSLPAEHAIAHCLAEADIRADQLNYVAVAGKPLVSFDRLVQAHLSVAPGGFRAFRTAVPEWARETRGLPKEIRALLGPNFRGELRFMDHHEAHAANAFFTSPFEDAAILSLGPLYGWGTGAIGVGQGNRITLTHETLFPHSLGTLHSALSYYCGFGDNAGEPGLLELAGSGEPRYAALMLDEIASVQADGSLCLDMSCFGHGDGTSATSDRLNHLLGGPPREPGSGVTQKEMDLAASFEVVCAEVVQRAAVTAHAVSGRRSLVLSGEAGRNCAGSGRLLQGGPFESVWIQPVCGEAGGALGAALATWYQILHSPREPRRSDTRGAHVSEPSFSNEDIGIYLDSIGASYERIDGEEQLRDRVAVLLEVGKVVGWFRGRPELGPGSPAGLSILDERGSMATRRTMSASLVCTPEDAFQCFAATEIDCLIVENYLLHRDAQRMGLALDSHVRGAPFPVG